MPAMVTADDVTRAADRLADGIRRTPCDRAPTLDALCGEAVVYVKREYLHPTGSFKERGARNALLQLSADAQAAGVIAASAGNHAQALAYHGRDLGIAVSVVMPRWAPLVKVNNCRRLGADVTLSGDSFEDARRLAVDLAASDGMTYVHGFNDDAVIAGAGTVAIEVLDDVPDVEVVIIPVGGGGLIAGMATYIKDKRPDCRVVGVETEAAPTLSQALAAGQPVDVETATSIADGLAIGRLGDNCFAPCREYVDEVVTVSEAEAARAVLRLLEGEKAVVEGAGAASLAAATGPLKKDLAGKKVALILCGGNIDVQTLGRVIERGLAADGRLCRIACRTSDRPGSLAKLLDLVGKLGAGVKEVHHDRSFGSGDIGRVDIELVLETDDKAHAARVREAVLEAGYLSS